MDPSRRLKMKVIWKWGAEIQDLPENVKTVAWAPQQDLLGHKNLKGIIDIRHAEQFCILLSP